MATVLFVGSRQGALRAAARLGLRVLLLGSRRPGGIPAGRFGRLDPGATGEEVVAAARRLAQGVRPDAVVALTEQAVVPAAMVREALGLEGAGGAAAAAWNDKVAMKRAVEAAGIPCASWVEVEASTRPAHLVARLGLPMVVKPRRSSGSRGNTVVRHPAPLRHLMEDDHIAESFVHGTEMSVEAFVSRGRILFRNVTQYLIPLWANVVPASVDASQQAQVDDLLRRSIAALGVRRGMVHLELFLGANGPVFGEMAVRPPGGHIMDLLELAWGFDPWEALLRVALGESPRLPTEPVRAAGVFILHPGQGVVDGVEGLEQTRHMPGVVDVRCRVAGGDDVDVREGSGNEVGRILVAAATSDAAASALLGARERLSIRMRPDSIADSIGGGGVGMAVGRGPGNQRLPSDSSTASVSVSSSSATSSRNSSAIG